MQHLSAAHSVDDNLTLFNQPMASTDEAFQSDH